MTTKRKPVSKRRAPKIRCGSVVTFLLSGHKLKATVIEDPRPIGPGGVNLLRISADLHDGIEPLECDVFEDRVTAVPVRRRRAA